MLEYLETCDKVEMKIGKEELYVVDREIEETRKKDNRMIERLWKKIDKNRKTSCIQSRNLISA